MQPITSLSFWFSPFKYIFALQFENKKSNHFRDWILLVWLGQRSSSLMNVVGVVTPQAWRPQQSRGGSMPRIVTNNWFSVFWSHLSKSNPFMDTWFKKQLKNVLILCYLQYKIKEYFHTISSNYI